MSDEEYRDVLKNDFGLHLQVNRPVWIEQEGYVLHSPRNSSDWDSYHRIRKEQIHNRYCPTLTYNPNDPEEKASSNFPLVFRDEKNNQVIGTIRIDLLEDNEAAFRWIAIDAPFVRQGFGSKMLKIAEEFVCNRKREVIRIPATHESLGFALRSGYQKEAWALMPKEECMVAVSKHLVSHMNLESTLAYPQTPS